MSRMDTGHALELLRHERQRLIALLRDVNAEDPQSESESEAIGELSSADQHSADEASETASRTVELSLREHVGAELAEIDAALARIDAGTYGICEVCGQPIEEERLEAVPYTRFCARDQRIIEQQGRAGV